MARRLARTTGRLPARAGDRSLWCRPYCRPAAVGARGKGLVTAATRPRLAILARRPGLARTRKQELAVGPDTGLTAAKPGAFTSPEIPGLAASPGRAGKAAAPCTGREGRVAVSPRRLWMARLRWDRFAVRTGRVRLPRHRPAAGSTAQPEPTARGTAVGAEGRSRSAPGRLPAPVAFQGFGSILAAA
jgi:hypothetical protein